LKRDAYAKTRDACPTVNIICFGDSITEAAEVGRPGRWPHLLQLELDRWQPGRFRVFNRGVGGNTTAQGFDRLDTDVIALLPGLVLVQFGFNDANVRDWAAVPRVGLAEYQKNLREFDRIAKQHAGGCVFLGQHALGVVAGVQGNAQAYEHNAASYHHAMCGLARELETPFVDLRELMRGERIDVADFVLEDGIHLSRVGNQHYARMVFARLKTLRQLAG
jgi:lysophospholipase L1-like esterase